LSAASNHRAYIADFTCLAARIVIEVDGSQNGEDRAIEYDAKRTAWLESQRYTVLRFWNTEVFTNTDGVLEAIYGALYESSNEAPRPLKYRRRRR
jgi:very-short-patch-repair endonuclease